MRGRGNAAYRWICATVVALAMGVAYSASVGAQEISAEGRAELEALFDEILKNPTDLDLTYKYAQEATRLGDYEAAITAYERLLLFNPDLPRVKAELGVLYYRLGSFDTSRAYLQEALASGPPAAARERIEGFLARIDASKRRHSFSGSASAGLRYQTNANYGPDGTILVTDIPAIPDDDTEGGEDWNVFAALSGRYVYDLGNDAGDFFSVEGTFYGARQFEFTDLDVEHVRLTAGPGFRLYPTDSGPVVFRPTLRLTYVRLDNESYNYAAGMGADFTWQAFEDTSLFLSSFAEGRDYKATEKRPNAGTQDGAAVRATTGAIHRLTDTLSLKAEATGARIYADDASEAYGEYGGGLTLAAEVPSPFAGSETLSVLGAPWSVTASARYLRRTYEGPNLLVSTKTRDEDDVRFDAAAAVPIGRSWSVFATVGYQDNGSNIPNNDFENFSMALGASLRF